MLSKKFDARAVLVIFAFGAFAYLQQIPAQGWVSDDYVEVFDNGVTPYSNLSQTLKLCGNGHYTVARILGLPFKLYVGYWLGPVSSHYLQAGLHVACALLFFRLLKLLKFPTFTSMLAAVIFVVSPWLSQAVVWWATMITPAATLCVLLGACLYVQMLYGTLRRRVTMPVVCVLVLANLFFYELWLFTPVLFVFLSMYVRLDDHLMERLSLAAIWRVFCRSLFECWPAFAVVLLWAVAYKLMPVDQVREGHIVVRRVLPVLASIHFRSYAWITRTPWRTALRDGVRYAGAWWYMLAVAMAGFLAVVSSISPTLTQSRRQQQLLLRVFLAWGIFLASRLVFVLMTGVGFNTRHNYGAAMAVALFIAGACEYAYSNIKVPRTAKHAVTALIILVLTSLAITSAGIRHHYVATSHAEQLTLRMLKPIAQDMAVGDTIVIVGPATDTQGELGYFSESTGLWLERLLQSTRPGIHAYVVPTIKIAGNHIVIPLTDRPATSGDISIDLRTIRLFEWTAGALHEIRTDDVLLRGDR